jgi:hypothetical protein
VPIKKPAEGKRQAQGYTGQKQRAHGRRQRCLDVADDDPVFTYAIPEEDSGIASVGLTTGLVTFQQSGTCLVRVTTESSGYLVRTFEFRLTGTVGTANYHVPDAFAPSTMLLVLYNADSTDGATLKNYYRDNRPGVSGANYLGITGVDDATYANASQCASLVSQVRTWLNANPSKPIRYIVGLCGLPSRVAEVIQDGCWAGKSVSYMLYQNALSISGGPGY